MPVSGLTGLGLDALMQAVFAADAVWNRRVPTAALNRWLAAIQEHHPPPLVGGRRLRLRYMTQVNTRPPSFALFASKPGELPESYRRYLVNALRQDFDLPGTPIRMMLRKGDNPYAAGIEAAPRRRGPRVPVVADTPFRQVNACDGALARVAVDLDRAAMQLDQPFGQRQPEADAVVFAVEAAIDLAERRQRDRDLFRASCRCRYRRSRKMTPRRLRRCSMLRLTLPPGGVNLIALDSRLTRICVILAGSAGDRQAARAAISPVALDLGLARHVLDDHQAQIRRPIEVDDLLRDVSRLASAFAHREYR